MTQQQPYFPTGIFPDALALRSAMQQGKVTARAALEAVFAAIDARNDKVNAIIYQDREAARTRADECDHAASPIGPLHGVPVTIKECFDWAGHPTTWGDPARQDRIADNDSEVVARLKRAGAIVFGKTNIPPYLSDWETANPLFGATRNPHDPTHSAGGSSGGSAAAVACGMSYVDIGSDQGGSIRYPAHNCGIHGLKPSWGSVSMRGHSPLSERRMPDIGAAGPLARSARDAALAFSVLSGTPLPDGPTPLTRHRFAQLPPQPGCPISRGYQAMIDAFAARLRKAGARVDITQPNIDFERATEVMNLLVRAETARKTQLITEFRNRQGGQAGTGNAFDALNTKGTGLSHLDWLILHEERLEMCEEMHRFFADFDILLCPAAAGPAPPLQVDGTAATRTVPVDDGTEPILRQHMLHMPGSLLYLPAHVMPIGTFPGGLPAGIQLVGAFGQDHKLLAAAQTIGQLAPVNEDIPA